MSNSDDGKQHREPASDRPEIAGSGAESAPAAGNENDVALLEADLRKLQEERDALFERVARVQADFRNAQNRLEGEKEQAIQYANANLVKAMLPVIDSFERGLEADLSKTDAQSMQKGMSMVHDHLLKVLQDNHVEVIAPETGTGFDPNLHQAIMQQPDERYNEPVVLQLLQKGYIMHGRVLRPAQVIVSKAS